MNENNDALEILKLGGKALEIFDHVVSSDIQQREMACRAYYDAEISQIDNEREMTKQKAKTKRAKIKAKRDIAIAEIRAPYEAGVRKEEEITRRELIKELSEIKQKEIQANEKITLESIQTIQKKDELDYQFYTQNLDSFEEQLASINEQLKDCKDWKMKTALLAERGSIENKISELKISYTESSTESKRNLSNIQANSLNHMNQMNGQMRAGINEIDNYTKN